jgi:class 3 adenylate cyclase
LEGIAKPGAICLSEDAYRQVSPGKDGGPQERNRTPSIFPPFLSVACCRAAS